MVNVDDDDGPDVVVPSDPIRTAPVLIMPHQLRDAFLVAEHMARRDASGKVEIVPATPQKERQAEFIMLRDGVIIFEGDADTLRASQDPYIKDFLS